jgi:hypothetical protein
MSDKTSACRDTSNDDNRKAVYEQLCESYRAIDDFRTKLLSFLPLVTTGAGIFLLATEPAKLAREFLLPIGLFGIVITIGLLCYEIHGIKKCGRLIQAGESIEGHLEVAGQFKSRPRHAAGFIHEPFATSIVYPAVIAAWTYLAFVPLCSAPHCASIRIVVSIGVFVGFFALIFYWTRAMESDLDEVVEYRKEPDIRKLFVLRDRRQAP